jgi:hypothetical protein
LPITEAEIDPATGAPVLVDRRPINPSARYVAAWRQPPERSTHG